MKDLSLTSFEQRGALGLLWLERPEVKNALSPQLMSEVLSHLQFAEHQDSVKAVALLGRGADFCAGADLQWMSGQQHQSAFQQYQSSKHLDEFFYQLARFPKLLVGLLQGNIFGGGVGFAACCDVNLGMKGVRFCLSEVKLGVAPAVIAPYLERKVAPSLLRYWSLTGVLIEDQAALESHLIHELLASSDINSVQDFQQKAIERIETLLKVISLDAMLSIKSYWNQRHLPVPAATERTLARLLITDRRQSADGQEGMKALLEKRKPRWS